MKKNLTYLLLFISYFSYGQLSSRVGINYANFATDPSPEDFSYKSILGFHIGIMYNLNVSEKADFRPSLLYTTRGAKAADDQESVKAVTSYIDMPLSFLYYLGQSKDKGIYVELGPNIMYILSAKSEGEDFKEEFNKVDIGALVGLGYNVSTKVGIGANYNLGLSNIAKDVDDLTVNNRNISVYLNLKF